MPNIQKPHSNPINIPLRKEAYEFDGMGNLKPTTKWKVSEGVGPAFNWYHIEFPRERQERWMEAAVLIPLLSPPLRLGEIMDLVCKALFCENFNDDEASPLILGMDFFGKGLIDFPLRIAARVTNNSILTISWGRVPGLGFGSWSMEDLGSVSPRLEEANVRNNVVADAGNQVFTMVDRSMLASMRTSSDNMNKSMSGQPVPKRIAGMLVHVLSAQVEHIQLAASKLKAELSSLMLKSRYSMMEDKTSGAMRCSFMARELRQLMQLAKDGEKFFSSVRKNCAAKIWFTSGDDEALEKLIGRLKEVKRDMDLVLDRVTRLEEEFDSQQGNKINRKGHYITSCTTIFLPLTFLSNIWNECWSLP